MRLYEKRIKTDDILETLKYIENLTKVEIAHEIQLLIAYYDGRLSVYEASEKLKQL
jgi:hypothetical protein